MALCCPYCPDHPGLQVIAEQKAWAWVLVLVVPEPEPLEVDFFNFPAKEVQCDFFDEFEEGNDREIARSFEADAAIFYEMIATYPQRLNALRNRMRKQPA